MKKWLKNIAVLFTLAIGCISMSACASCSPNTQDSNTSQDSTPAETVSITLDYSKIKMTRGETRVLTATKSGTESAIEWYSYDESIVSVNENGEITAWGSGKTTVLAIVDNQSASCEILVVEPEVEKNDYVLHLSSTEVRINGITSEKTSLTATVTHNDKETDADIEWLIEGDSEIVLQTDSEDKHKATIMATENGKSATVIIKAVVDGVILTGYCNVYSDVFTKLSVSLDSVSLFGGDTFDLKEDVELWKDGVLLSGIPFDYVSMNPNVATVDENGVITGHLAGETNIIVSYDNNYAVVPVSVGATVYISTAEQFLSIDGADAHTRFILTDNVDLSAYLKENPAINETCLIEEFNAELDGQGYCVSGWYRLSTGDDRSFRGVFANINEDARISNLHFKAYIDGRNPTPVICETNAGDFENCIFEIQGIKGFVQEGSSLFKMTNGEIKNTLFIIEGAWSKDARFAISNGGYGVFEDCAVIAPTLTNGAYINKSNNIANTNLSDCYYYQNTQAFIEKSAYTITITGSTDAYDFGTSSNYDKNLFYIEEGRVYLKNEKSEKPIDYKNFSVEEYKELSVGEVWTLPVSEIEGTVDVEVLDSRNRIVTADVVKNGVFQSGAQGKYQLFYYLEENGVYSCALTTVNVVLPQPTLNAYSVLLNENETYDLIVSGVDGQAYCYYSQDETVATVSENGRISGVSVGETYILIVSENGAYSFNVKVEVVAQEKEYVEVKDKQSLLTALNNSTKDSYVVLTEDIVFEYSDMIKGGLNSDTDETPVKSYRGQHPYTGEWKDFNCYYRYLVRDFHGTFDGQGHKITVRYEGDADDIMCGMFLNLSRTSLVQNLYYVFEGTYTPTDAVPFTSAFVRTCYGAIQSSYFDATFNKTVYRNSAGVIAYFQDRANGTEVDLNTANCYNCLFNVRMTVNGEIQEGGYSFRIGSSEPHAYDSVLIRNTIATDFYGDFNNGASGVSCTGCYHYRTAYDFVNAISGNSYSLQRISTPVLDGQKVYSNWGGEWQINGNGIYFFGRKVLDTAFERYNQPMELPVSEDYGTLSWSLNGETDIYINGSFIKSTTEKSFALSEYLLAKYGEKNGTYNVLIKGELQSAVIVYEMLALDQSNFFKTVNTIRSEQDSAFKYFFLMEDIDLSSVSGENVHVSGKCIFTQVYTDLDGRGHTIKWNHTQTSGAYHGFACEFINATWKNVALKGKVTLGNSVVLTGVLAYQAVGSTFENCYMEVNVNSEIAEDVPLIDSIRAYTLIRNCIVVLNDENKTDDYSVVLAGENSHASFYRNSVFVCDVTTERMFGSKYNFMTVSGSYQYTEIHDFIEGNSGLRIALDNAKYTIVGVSDKTYTDLPDIWTVSDSGIFLNGKVIYNVVKIGDNDVLDSDIL